jgi:hypothetical protein
MGDPYPQANKGIALMCGGAGDRSLWAMNETTSKKTSLLTGIGGGTTLATILAVGAIAFWPASETDKARSDGEAFGTAVAQLQSATTYEEVDAAMVDVRDAAASTADHVSDEVADQVDAQVDALDRAVDGFVGERHAGNEFDQDLYHLELDIAVDDLATQAEDFRAQGPEVRQAFWEGYESGVTA